MKRRRFSGAGITIVEAVVYCSVAAFTMSFIARLLPRPLAVALRIANSDQRHQALRGLDVLVDDLKGADLPDLWAGLYPPHPVTAQPCGMARVCNGMTYPLCTSLSVCSADLLRGITWFQRDFYDSDTRRKKYVLYYFVPVDRTVGTLMRMTNDTAPRVAGSTSSVVVANIVIGDGSRAFFQKVDREGELISASAMAATPDLEKFQSNTIQISIQVLPPYGWLPGAPDRLRSAVNVSRRVAVRAQ